MARVEFALFTRKAKTRLWLETLEINVHLTRDGRLMTNPMSEQEATALAKMARADGLWVFVHRP